jgi:hypothetical protein
MAGILLFGLALFALDADDAPRRIAVAKSSATVSSSR